MRILSTIAVLVLFANTAFATSDYLGRHLKRSDVLAVCSNISQLIEAGEGRMVNGRPVFNHPGNVVQLVVFDIGNGLSAPLIELSKWKNDQILTRETNLDPYETDFVYNYQSPKPNEFNFTLHKEELDERLHNGRLIIYGVDVFKTNMDCVYPE